MIKLFNYFLQSALIYFFFALGRIMGIKLSRKIFSFLFLKTGPIFKSKEIINQFTLNEITILFSDSTAPTIIRDSSKSESLYVLMPMRV